VTRAATNLATTMEPVSTPVADSTSPVFEVENLYKVFHTDAGAVMALRDVNLDVRPGEFLSFVGPSGCGKSTLLNIIAGLLPASSGEVRFKGTAIDEPSRDIGMMFQTSVLFPWRTILQNVLMPVEIFGWDKKEYTPKALELLKAVGLESFVKAYPSQLSGGMQQRASLARVLLYDPEVLLLDEPFGALDEFTRENMNLELLKIWTQTGKTVVFVTHNINEAVFLSDRVVVMTPRPGEVARVLDVDLPRPRRLEVMKDQRFADLVFEVRELLGVA
jgi:NitT/TauT family transport system ATP-binding protein